MDNAPADPEQVNDGAADFDSAGAPRALSVEATAQTLSGGVNPERLASFRVQGFLETENFGALSLDLKAPYTGFGDARQNGAGASLSVYQIDMPFGGGWYASQGLGIVQTLSPRLSGQQASFFLPSRLVRGASTQWRNDTRGLTLQLSGGETGAFSSVGSGQFHGTGSHVSVIGISLEGQRNGTASLLSPGWSYGAMLSSASGSPNEAPSILGARSAEVAGGGIFQALRWEAPDAVVQGNVLFDRGADRGMAAARLPIGVSTARVGSRTGLWLDASRYDGDVTQRMGLHHLAPDLQWEGSALGGNSQGGYYRWSRSGLRSQFEAQVSRTQPVDASRGTAPITQAGATVRQYIDRDLNIGGVAQLVKSRSSAFQFSGYAELKREAVDHRFQLSFDVEDDRIVGRRMSADQSWAWQTGRRLTTSQVLVSNKATTSDRYTSSERGTAIELAVAGSADLGDRLTFDINAAARVPLSSSGTRAYTLSASGRLRVATGWSLDASLGLSRASGVINPQMTDPVPSLFSTPSPFRSGSTNSREFRVTLRYDFQAGSSSVPVGGKAGAGGGAIEGTVYLDANENGRPDANETRASNATVSLDGRFSVRTDAQGRFSFPFVASGRHALQVQSETLPLPWTMPGTEPIKVDVDPRETRRIELGATREHSAPTRE
jgi:hypothetical protein